MEDRIKGILTSHYFEGILLMAFGVIMILMPEKSIDVISMVSGLILCVLGAVLSVYYVIHNKERHTLELFAGLMCLALGFEFVFRSENLGETMHIVLSITLIYSGTLFFIQAYDLIEQRNTLFYFTAAFALMAVVFAILMLIHQQEDVTVFTCIKGASMILEGFASLFVIKSSYIKD